MLIFPGSDWEGGPLSFSPGEVTTGSTPFSLGTVCSPTVKSKKTPIPTKSKLHRKKIHCLVRRHVQSNLISSAEICPTCQATLHFLNLNQISDKIFPKSDNTKHSSKALLSFYQDVSVKCKFPHRQQSLNKAKLSIPYILTTPHPQRHVVFGKREKSLGDLTVQVC